MNIIKTYQCLQEEELLTPVIKANGEKIHIRFFKDRTHPKYGKIKGIFQTTDHEIQWAIENDDRYGVSFQKV